MINDKQIRQEMKTMTSEFNQMKVQLADSLGEINKTTAVMNAILQNSIENTKDIKAWLVLHEANDKTEHGLIHARISQMKKYAGGIAVVAFVGGLIASSLEKTKAAGSSLLKIIQ